MYLDIVSIEVKYFLYTCSAWSVLILKYFLKYNSIYEVSISSALYSLLDSNVISISKDNLKHQFNVISIIDNDNLIIYQNGYWSYSLFKDIFEYLDYKCIGLTIGFSKNDEKSKELLSREYLDFEFMCPLKEVKKEIDNMVGKIQMVLVVLSSFCIVVSLLLLAIIIFINTFLNVINKSIF